MEEDIFDANNKVSLDDIPEKTTEESEVSNLVNFVMDRYRKAEDTRRQDEDRWLQAYRNYRGLYGPDVQFTEAEKSRVFIKVTKTKTLAAYGQIIDVLFANNTFPLTVEPTKLPEGVEETVHFDPQKNELDQRMGEPVSPYGFAGDGNELPPGATLSSLTQKGLGPLENKLDEVEGLVSGAGTSPSAINFSPAMVAAKKMQKKIHDQLEESHASKQLRSSSFEMALFGTGIMKGPFAIDKEYPNWDETGEYNPVVKTVPSTSHVSVWNFYPDPDASNMDEAQFVIERHKMSRSQLRALAKRPFFRSNVIDEVIDMGEGYVKKYWEDDLKDYTVDYDIERFEVLEYWGNIDVAILQDTDVKIPDELANLDEVQANIWYCNGRILRAVLNPFKPTFHTMQFRMN
jgi:hypothetical protein